VIYKVPPRPPVGLLFISSSIGLGHAARDLAIAKEMKKRNPDIEISWLEILREE